MPKSAWTQAIRIARRSAAVRKIMQLPTRTLRRLYRAYMRAANVEVNRTAFRQKNIAGAELILDRRELLNRLPKAGTVAELGVDRGDFSQTILEITRPAQLVLIDSWGSAQYGLREENVVSARFERQIADKQVLIIKSLSIPAATGFEDGSFDWIYLDTDHSYKTTIAELRTWAIKVKPKGLIAGHDYTTGNVLKGLKFGVIEAVTEFCVQENWKLAYLTADYTEGFSFAITRMGPDSRP